MAWGLALTPKDLYTLTGPNPESVSSVPVTEKTYLFSGIRIMVSIYIYIYRYRYRYRLI